MLDEKDIKQIKAIRIGYEMSHTKDLEDLTMTGHITIKQYEAIKQLSIFVLREFENRVIEKLGKGT